MGCAECGGVLGINGGKQAISQLVYMGITAATRFAPLAGKLFRRVVGLGRILERRRGEPPGPRLLESRRLGVTETPVRIPHTCN
jgi:hypothetical protein